MLPRDTTRLSSVVLPSKHEKGTHNAANVAWGAASGEPVDVVLVHVPHTRRGPVERTPQTPDQLFRVLRNVRAQPSPPQFSGVAIRIMIYHEDHDLLGDYGKLWL